MDTDKWTAHGREAPAGGIADNTVVLAPPEAFPDGYASASLRTDCGCVDPPKGLGPNSGAVAARLARSCAGWVTPPTSEEFFAALRAPTPTERERQLISTWLFEATNEDLIQAWLEEAYSFRQLVRAIHNAGAEKDYPERNHELNCFAGVSPVRRVRPWLDP